MIIQFVYHQVSAERPPLVHGQPSLPAADGHPAAARGVGQEERLLRQVGAILPARFKKNVD